MFCLLQDLSHIGYRGANVEQSTLMRTVIWYLVPIPFAQHLKARANRKGLPPNENAGTRCLGDHQNRRYVMGYDLPTYY